MFVYKVKRNKTDIWFFLFDWELREVGNSKTFELCLLLHVQLEILMSVLHYLSSILQRDPWLVD